MHSNSILTSNLLDIIFEHRNKDYGAYVLRKNYPKRLLMSLLTMLALVVAFCLSQMFKRKSPMPSLTSTPFIVDPSISSARQFERVEQKKTIHPQVKAAKPVSDNPVIVNDNFKQVIPAVNFSSISLNPGNDESPQPFDGKGASEAGTRGSENSALEKPSVISVNKNNPDISPEVLPQYPGGTSELIKFLKRNLHTPRELEDGEEISVKIKFVVSLTGDLLSFSVVEKGGEPFDSEVMRVLKKMPKWIPGKTRGENVSAYFIIPIKFTVSN